MVDKRLNVISPERLHVTTVECIERGGAEEGITFSWMLGGS